MYPHPIKVEENYWEIGISTHRYPQKNKYVDSQYFEPLSKYTSGDYSLSHVDRVDEVVKTHLKYAYSCSRRDAKLLDEIVPTLDSVIYELFQPALEAPMLDNLAVLSIQVPNKGAGFGCSGVKSACYSKNPGLCKYCIDHPEDFQNMVPIWVASGKLEVRLKTKECRCYLIAPMWFQMQLQRFCKVQNMKMLDHRFDVPSAVGMVLPFEWTELHKHLHRYENPEYPIRFFGGDIEKFDSMQYRKFYHLVQRIRAKGLRLTGENLKQFKHLYYNIINRIVVLPDGTVVYTKDGNPSGSPNTTTDNGIIHIAKLAVCWKLHTGSISGFVAFIRRSGYLVFGDDCIAAINCLKDESFFTALPAIWLKVYGSNFKTEIMDEWKDVHFLGAQPLGNIAPLCYLTKPYDIDRQITNLIKKGAKTFDPFVELQRAIAHRSLLVFTSAVPDHLVLDDLKKCTQTLIDDYSEVMSGNNQWDVLVTLHKMSDFSFIGSIFGDGYDHRPNQSNVSSSLNRSSSQRDESTMSAPLTYVQWCQKHTGKLSDLSKSDKKSRYQQYLASKSSTANARSTGPQKSKPSGVLQPIGTSGSNPSSSAGNSSGVTRTWSSNDYATMLHNYAMSMGNPWDPTYNGAKVISTMAQDSSVINVCESFTAGCPSVPDPSDANIQYSNTGFGGFVANPTALFMNYMYTPGNQQIGFTAPEDNDQTQSPGLICYTPANETPLLALNLVGGTTVTDPSTLLYPNSSPANPAWISLTDCEEIQNLSSKFRLVSAGVTFEFISTAISGSGELAFGLIPPELFKQRGLIMNDTNFEVIMKTLTWEEFLKMEGVQKCPAIEGCTLVWNPYDVSATEYRESILQYVSSEDTVTGVGRVQPSKSQLKKSFARKKSTSSSLVRDYDATQDCRKTKEEKLQELEKKRADYLDLCRAKGRKPNPKAFTVGVDPASDFLPTIEFLGASFGVPLPCDGDQDIMSSVATSVAMAGELAAQAGAGTFSLQSQDEIIIECMELNPNPACPYMVVMWNGVAPPLAPNVVGAYDSYVVNYFCNYEIIPDEQTFRIAQSPATVAYVGNGAPAIAAVKTAAISAPGEPAAPKSVWSKIKSGFSSAVKTGIKIAGYVGKAAKIADEIGDVVAAFA